jgi:Zn-finger nucleic acid-binding protein
MSDGRPLACPRCRSPLASEPTTGRHPCPACRGVFLQRVAVAPLLEGLRALPPGAPEGSPYRGAAATEPSPLRAEAAVYLSCPFCSRLMNRTRIVERVGIVIDMCHAHGVWFDAGELELAGQHLRQARDEQKLHTPGALLEELFELGTRKPGG